MTRLISGKIKKTPSANADPNRYSWLDLQNAEPDLGVPSSNGSLFVSSTTGNRSWTDTITISGSVATINTLTVTGNSNLGSNNNVKISGGGPGQFLVSDGSNNLIWSSAAISTASGISNDQSSVVMAAPNGNIAMSVAGTSNVIVVSNVGAIVTGNVGVGGNITAANITANTGIFTGNGSGLSSIAGANVTGTVPSATTASTAGTVTTNAQPNITSTGTLAGLNVIGNANINGTTIDTSGNLTAPFVFANVFGNISGNLAVSGSNGEVIFNNEGNTGTSNAFSFNRASNVLTVTGNIGANFFTGNGSALSSITGANVSGQVSFAATANTVAGANVSGTVANATFATTAGSTTTAGTVTTNAQPNITSLGTLSNLNVSGNTIISGNLTVDGNLVYVNVETLSVEDPIIQLQTGPNGGAPVANSGKDVGTALNYYDTQARVAFMGWDVSNVEFGLASQASITNEVVTFTSYGNLRVGNIIGNGQALTGLNGANVTGAVAFATTANSVAGANVSGTVANATFATSAGSATTAGTVTTNAQSNITSVGTLTGLGVDGNITAANITANTGVFTGNGSGLTAIPGANVTGTVANATFATSAGVVTTNAQPNITSTGTLTDLTVGNTTANTIFGNGTINATGNISASTFFGNLVGNFSGNIVVPGSNGEILFNNAGNAGASNAFTFNTSSNALSVNGTITAPAFTANTGVFTGNGNGLSSIVGANVTGAVAFATTANAVAGANVTGTVSTATTAGTVTTNAQPNITSVGTLDSLTATGNATAGNLTTGGVVTATGNVSGGNLTTAGVLTVTGTGVSSIAGNLDMTSNTIINLASPVNSTDAATKQYVDDIAQGLHTHDSCNAATSTTLATSSGGTVTYDNGTSGIGATLTTTGTYTTIDGVTLSNGMRILVKNEANTAHNGIYDRTSSTVLTRSSDFDTPVEMAGGDFTFVNAGTLYDNTGWVMPDAVTTVGTSPIVWVQFSGAGTYTAGTGLTLTGSQFSVNASQTQVTSVGTLTDLTVGNSTANIIFGNGTITSTGNITAPFVFANVQGNISGNFAVTGSNTEVIFNKEGNAGSSNAFTFNNATNALSVSGTVTATAFTANTGVFTGSGANLTTLNASNISSGTLDQTRLANSSLTVNGTAISLGGSGTVTANTTQTLSNGTYITGDAFNGGTARTWAVDATTTNTANKVVARDTNGSFSANIITATLSGSATSAGTATTAGTVTTNAQPNITSVGTLTELTVGNVTANIIFGNGTINATGNISAPFVFANVQGNISGNFAVTGSNTEVIFNKEGNAGSSNAFTFNNATNALSITGTINASGNANVLNLGTARVIATGNISGTQLISNIADGTAPLVVTSTTQVANLSVATAGSATTAGTVTTNAQPNITSVGNLTSLTISGNLSSGNANLGNTAVANFFVGDGTQLINLPISTSLANGTSNVNISTANGNVNTSVGGTANVLIVTATGANIAGTLNATGNVTVGNLITGAGIGGNISGANVVTANTFVGALTGAATTAGTVTTNAQSNITSVGTLTSLIVGNATANTTFGNGTINAAGNITAPFVFANVVGNISGNFAVTGSNGEVIFNKEGNAGSSNGFTFNNTTNALSVTGNITGSNLVTAGIVVATGNVTTSANLVTNLIVGRTAGITITAAGANTNITLAPVGTGTVDVSSKRITNLATPSATTDAATKAYVDSVAEGLTVKAACKAATAGTLADASGGTITYDNGTDGVGATLTTTGSYTAIDGVTLTNGDRVLVKNEVTAANNGIYVRTSTTVLTRAADFDNTPSGEVAGAFTFITNGSTNADTGFVCTTNNPVVMGTTAINFTQFSGAGTYTAGTGLVLTGSVFSIANTAVTAATYGNGDRVASFTVNAQGQLTNAANTVIAANAANLSGTTLNSGVVTSSLTTVGTLGNLAVTSNITSGNATLGNLAIANFFQGDGSLLTNVPIGTSLSNGTSNVSIPAANGNVNTTVAGTTRIVATTTGANVTGTLGVSGNANVLNLGTARVIATGNISSGNADLGNAAIANYFIGDGSQLTGVPGGQAIVNGTSNVAIPVSNGNVNISVGGSSNRLVVTTSGANITGTLGVSGNANVNNLGTATALITTGNITTINSGLLQNGTSNVVVAASGGNVTLGVAGTDRITATTTGANVTGTLGVSGNANVGNIGGAAGVFTTVAGNLTTNAQPNITSVGTLTSLAVTGAVTADTFQASNNGSGTNFKIGDDAWIGDVNQADTISIRGVANAANGYIVFGNADATTKLGRAGSGALTYNGTVNPTTLQTTTLTTGANTTAGTVTGNWTLTAGSRWQSTYADLAERYVADKTYEPGTVVVLGGDQEVTIENIADSHKVAGVITTNPAYIMNAELQGDNVVEVALIGRVPCKVMGPVNKGDLLTTATIPGYAYANNTASAGRIVGKSLENFNGELGIVEIMVGKT